MYCKKCGQKLADDSLFCPNCGEAVAKDANPSKRAEDKTATIDVEKQSGMRKIVCELCSSNDIVKKDGFYVCQHCGTKYSIDEAKKLVNAVDVRVVEPVRVVNDEYETQMAITRNLITTYFSSRPDSVNYSGKNGYDAIIEAYTDAEKAGGAKESGYWEERSDFYVRANLEGFGPNPIYADREGFLREFSRLMDFAIKYADEDDKKRLRDKKAEKIRSLSDKYDQKHVHYVDDGSPVFRDTEEPSPAVYERIRDNGTFSRISNAVRSVFYKNGSINVRLLTGIGIVLALVILIVGIKACSGSHSDTSTEKQKSIEENQSPNGDLILSETEVSVDKDGNITRESQSYYVYDADKNKEFEFATSSYPGFGNQTFLYYFIYNDAGEEEFRQNEISFGEEDKASLFQLNYYEGGKVISRVENNMTLTELEYDDKDQLVKETTRSVSGDGDRTVTHEYDKNGNDIKQVTDYPGKGTTIDEYQYDSEGRKVKWTTTSEFEGTPSQNSEITYEYDSKGDLIRENFPKYEYKYEYEYDNNGNLIKKTKKEGDETTTTTYKYISDPEDSKKNLDEIKKYLDLDSIVAESNETYNKFRNMPKDQILGELSGTIKKGEDNDIDDDYPVIPYKSKHLGQYLNINSGSYTFVDANNLVANYPGFTRYNDTNYYYCSQTKDYYGVDKTGKIVARSSAINDSVSLAKFMGTDGIIEGQQFIEPRVIAREDGASYAVWKYAGGGYLMVVIHILPDRDIREARVLMHSKEVADINLDKYLSNASANSSSDEVDVEQNRIANEDVDTGGLSEAVFEQVKGHYEDEYEDAVDILSPDQLVRFIKGGHEDHTYDEKICGYRKLDNGYIIKVEWDGDKWTYFYTVQNGRETLYVNFDEGWNPGLNPYNHMEGCQIYIKNRAGDQQNTNNTATLTPTSGSNNSSWGMEDAYEGGMPQETFDIIKGTYKAAKKDIAIEIVSPTEAKIIDGTEGSLEIYGADCGDGYGDLDLYVTDNRNGGKGQFILTLMHFDGDIMMIVKEGAGWNSNSTDLRQTAGLSRVK